MARLFVLDTNWAEQACAVSRRHRTAAGWLRAAFEPTPPVPIARSDALHTWPVYGDAMRAEQGGVLVACQSFKQCRHPRAVARTLGPLQHTRVSC